MSSAETRQSSTFSLLSAFGKHLEQFRSRLSSTNHRLRQNFHSASNSRRQMSAPATPTQTKSLDPPDTLGEKWPSSGDISWPLTNRQRDLLIKSWRDDFDTLYTLGTTIYSHVFRKSPDAKVLFPQVANYGEKWQESGKFRSQALKFVQVLSHVIKHLHHPEQMDSHLYAVGRAHRKYKGRGFKPNHWDVFQSAIETAMTDQVRQIENLSQQDKIDAIQAWKCLALYLIKKMKLGFDQQDD